MWVFVEVLLCFSWSCGLFLCFIFPLFIWPLLSFPCFLFFFFFFWGNLPSIVLGLSVKDWGFQWSLRHEELFVLFSFYSRLLFCLLVLIDIFVLVSSFYYCLCPLYCISIFALVLCYGFEFFCLYQLFCGRHLLLVLVSCRVYIWGVFPFNRVLCIFWWAQLFYGHMYLIFVIGTCRMACWYLFIFLLVLCNV